MRSLSRLTRPRSLSEYVRMNKKEITRPAGLVAHDLAYTRVSYVGTAPTPAHYSVDPRPTTPPIGTREFHPRSVVDFNGTMRVHCAV